MFSSCAEEVKIEPVYATIKLYPMLLGEFHSAPVHVYILNKRVSFSCDMWMSHASAYKMDQVN